MNALCVASAAVGAHDVLGYSSVSAVGYETRLSEQWRARQLADAVQLLHNFLPDTPHHSARVKRLSWPLTDYERSLKFATSVQGQLTYSANVLFCHTDILHVR